jgi:hypothetical protein
MKKDIKVTKNTPANKVDAALIQALVKKDLEGLEAGSCMACSYTKCRAGQR